MRVVWLEWGATRTSKGKYIIARDMGGLGVVIDCVRRAVHSGAGEEF